MKRYAQLAHKPTVAPPTRTCNHCHLVRAHAEFVANGFRMIACRSCRDRNPKLRRIEQ